MAIPKRHILPALLALAGFALVYSSTSLYGPGLSPDGIAYLAAARSVAAGQGFLDYDGAPFAMWTPLFPILLSFFEYASGAAVLGARVINALSFSLPVFLISSLLLSAATASPRPRLSLTLALAGSLLLVTSFPLLKNAVMLWSEPLFVALLCLAGALYAFHSVKPTRMTALLLLLCCTLAALQRLLGVTVVATATVLLVLERRGTFLQRFRRAAVFAGAALVPLCAWLIRNLILTDTLTGPRESASTTLGEVLTRLAAIGTGLLVPPAVEPPLRFFVQGAVAALILLALTAASYALLPGRPGSLSPHHRAALLAALTFFGVYIATIICAVLTVGLEPLSMRYLSPLVPSLIICLGLMPNLITRGAPAAGTITVLLAALSLWSTVKVHEIWVEEGAGDYSVRRWQESQLLAWIETHRPQGLVLSNASDLVYSKTGLVFGRLPHKGQVGPEIFGEQREVSVAHFNRSFRPYMAPLSEIAPLCGKIETVRFPDGVFLICRRGT